MVFFLFFIIFHVKTQQPSGQRSFEDCYGMLPGQEWQQHITTGFRETFHLEAAQELFYFKLTFIQMSTVTCQYIPLYFRTCVCCSFQKDLFVGINMLLLFCCLSCLGESQLTRSTVYSEPFEWTSCVSYTVSRRKKIRMMLKSCPVKTWSCNIQLTANTYLFRIWKRQEYWFHMCSSFFTPHGTIAVGLVYLSELIYQLLSFSGTFQVRAAGQEAVATTCWFRFFFYSNKLQLDWVFTHLHHPQQDFHK